MTSSLIYPLLLPTQMPDLCSSVVYYTIIKIQELENSGPQKNEI